MSMHASFGAEAVSLRDAFVSRLRTLTEVLNNSLSPNSISFLKSYNPGKESWDTCYFSWHRSSHRAESPPPLPPYQCCPCGYKAAGKSKLSWGGWGMGVGEYLETHHIQTYMVLKVSFGQICSSRL